MSRGSTQIVDTGLVTLVMMSSSHNISVESLQESGKLESKDHLTDDSHTRLDDVISVVITNKKLSYRRETARQLRIHAQLTRCFSAIAV